MFDIITSYNVITPLIVVIICHYVNLSQYYWIYFPSTFHPSHYPLPSSGHPFGLRLYESIFVLFVLFLDSTYR